MVASPLEAQEAWDALTRTDDILAEILIRLPTFRRVITSAPFLRRLHALHPPSFLGFLDYTGRFQPVAPPHPSAPAARALAAAADFRFSFLPSPGFWVVGDARGGRFLLEYDVGGDGIFTTVAVCDPLFRRYVILPPIPQDLAAAVWQELKVVSRHVFLAPCIEHEVVAADAAEKKFMVVWMAQCPARLVAFVFSSATRQWRPIASPSWHDLNHETSTVDETCRLTARCYAYGCFYWSLSGSNLVALDTGRMEFFLVNLPTVMDSFGGTRSYGELLIVESRESSRRILMFHMHFSQLRIFCANRHNYGEGATEWVLKKEFSLPPSW